VLVCRRAGSALGQVLKRATAPADTSRVRISFFAGIAALVLAGCSSAEPPMHTGPAAADFACAPDVHGADAIVEAVNEHDPEDLKAATQFALAVAPGTPVQIVAHTEGQAPKVRVQVLDGPFKSERCWYPRNVEGIFAD